MPAKLKKNKPEYLYIKGNELGTHKDNDKLVRVIAGKYKKAEGPEKNHNVEPIYFHVILNEGKEFSCEAPDGHNSFIYLLKGQLDIGKKDHEKTSDSNLILLERGNKLILKQPKNLNFYLSPANP